MNLNYANSGKPTLSDVLSQIHRTCRLLEKDPVEAEELASNIIATKIAMRWEELLETAQSDSYFITICRNAWLDAYRRKIAVRQIRFTYVDKETDLEFFQTLIASRYNYSSSSYALDVETFIKSLNPLQTLLFDYLMEKPPFLQFIEELNTLGYDLKPGAVRRLLSKMRCDMHQKFFPEL